MANGGEGGTIDTEDSEVQDRQEKVNVLQQGVSTEAKELQNLHINCETARNGSI